MILLRQSSSEVMMILLCEMLFILPLMAVIIISRWKIFVKAGQEGWMSIIPIYNTYILTTKIAGKDDTTFVLHLIPLVNIYALIVTNIALAKSFGKDEGFGIGLSFLAIVFYPMLAFNKSTVYLGPEGNQNPNNNNTGNSDNLSTNWQNNDNPQQPPIV